LSFKFACLQNSLFDKNFDRPDNTEITADIVKGTAHTYNDKFTPAGIMVVDK